MLSVLRRFALVLVLASSLLLTSQPSSKVVSFSIDGVVAPITGEILTKAIEMAERENARLLLVRLDTPGGLLDATRTMVSKMSGGRIPVVTWVGPMGARAASAGFFLLEAGDVAAMAPGTNTGAASPIVLGQEMDETMRHKVENDTAAWLRSIVSRRGRNAALAEETVFKARSFSEKEALDSNLIELIAKDENDLLSKLDGREITRFDGTRVRLQTAGAQIVKYEAPLRERILWSISNPNIAFLLLILGALGVYVEFTHPGLIFPGVIGGILVLVGLFALSVLPINALGVALLLLSLLLFALEAIFTSHGILGAGGAVAMVLGAMLLVEGPPALRIHFATAVALALPFSLITVFLASLAVRAHRRKVMTGDVGMIGEIGEARTPLTPKGKVFVHGEYWDAESPVPVVPGTRVRVVAVEGLLLRVEPIV